MAHFHAHIAFSSTFKLTVVHCCHQLHKWY